MAQRKLAAIMFSDIVGYNSLLESDEIKAFKVLKNNLRIHRRLIKKYRGRLLKVMGDGILASFHSNIDAVICAFAIQKTTTEFNIPVRMGIHQGDVVFEKKDVLGDGVNVTSRIQGVIDTDGIVISEKVYSDIRNKEGFEIESLGTKKLKGVDTPIPVYKVSSKDNSLLDYSIDTGELFRLLSFNRATLIVGIMGIAFLAFAIYYLLPENYNHPSTPDKSILVLPPENYTNEDSLDYLFAGVHDAINSSIGRIAAFRVISTTSARAYNNPEKSIKEIASDAGVEYIVKTSLLCTVDKICLNVQMFNPDDEKKPLWDQEYNEDISQILNVYNKITARVSDEINAKLRPQEELLLAENRTVDPDAYDAYLKGKSYLEKINRESLPMAMEYFNMAIGIDPEWAPPYAGLAEAGQYGKQMGFESVNSTLPLIYKNLYRALELDPNSANSYYTKAVISVWTEYDWEAAEEAFSKSIELNPNDAMCRMFYGYLLLILRREDEAYYQLEQAIKLDPLRPFLLGLYANTVAGKGDYESAKLYAKKAISINPDQFNAKNALGRIYETAGDYEAWFEIYKNQYGWQYNDGFISEIEKVLHEQGYVAVIEALINYNEEKHRKGERIGIGTQAEMYMKIGNYDRAMDYYEEMYEKKDPNLPFISGKVVQYPELKDNPRYVALLMKMNLPLP